MILKSFVLINNNNKYLLIKEATKKWSGKWFLPGGKVEINETPELAAHRETKEEAGCTIKLKGIFYLHYNQSLLDNYLAIFYSASIVGETIKTFANNHSLEVKWFTLDEIKHLSFRQNLIEIIENFNKKHLIPTQHFNLF